MSWPLLSAATSRPMPITSTTMAPSVHIVERTVRIFVHSEASAWPSVVFCTGIGEVYAPGAPPCHVAAGAW